MFPYEDPGSPYNGPSYYTGLPCVILGCPEPAGTAWSPHFCQKHNAERINHIASQLDELIKKRMKDECN